MLCPKCISEIPDDSRACPRCRAVIVDRSPALAATDITRDIPQQEKRVRSLLTGILLVGVALALAAGFMVSRVARSRSGQGVTSVPTTRIERIPVAKTQFVLKSGVPVSFGFAVPAGCRSAALQSQFVLADDQGAAAVQMTVFDETSYANWRRHTASRALYTSKISTALTNLTLPTEPGRYFVVFSRGPSTLPATLQADVELLCGRGEP